MVAETLLRNAIADYPHEQGKLWIHLADYFTRAGRFAEARGVFEEALSKLTSVRDFGIIYNAYLKFEEAMLDVEEDEDEDQSEERKIDQETRKIQAAGYSDENEAESAEESSEDDLDPAEAKFQRLETLIERRPFLLSNIVLRQNPHNVYEWLNRITVCEHDTFLVIKTFTEAIKTNDPVQAFGKCSKVWVKFAKFYESHKELSNANLIFHKATTLKFKTVEELSHIYCSWAEMHIRNDNIESALHILKHACTKPAKRNVDSGSLMYNISAWSLYIDLLENQDDFEKTKSAYERVMQLKIATPGTVLNFADFLQRNRFFEESFRVYERAVLMFDWPRVYEIWVIYLSKMIEKYAGTKLERMRHLFE